MTVLQRRRLDARAVLRLLVGSVVGAVALWLTFRRTDMRVVADAMAQIHLWPVLAALLLVAATVIVAGPRRGVRRGPPGAARGGASPQCGPPIPVGQLLNLWLPVRLGEVVRAYWISRTEREPLGRVLATIAGESLGDVGLVGSTATHVATRA